MLQDTHLVVATVATVATDFAFDVSRRDVYHVLRFCHLTIYVCLKDLKKGFAGIVMIANTFLQNPRLMSPMQRLYLYL